MFGVGAHRPDGTRPSVFLQRKNGKTIARVQRGVEFAIHCRAARGDVRNVEQMLIGAARESNRERMG
jgi:hypothetical protein